MDPGIWRILALLTVLDLWLLVPNAVYITKKSYFWEGEEEICRKFVENQKQVIVC